MRAFSLQKILKKGLLCAILFLLMANVFGQDASYAQHYSSIIYTNPALTGVSTTLHNLRKHKISLHFRNRKTSNRHAYQTLNFSWQQHVNPLGGGLGVYYNRHIEGNGLLTTSQISVPYSYSLWFRKVLVRIGVQGSLVNRSLDFSNGFFLQPNQYIGNFKYQQSEPLPNQNVNFLNFSWGMVLNSNKYYAGFAWHNALDPNQSFYHNTTHYLSKRISFMAGGKLKIKKLLFYPDAIYQNQHLDAMLKAGMNVKYRKMVLGYHHALINENNEAIINLGYSSNKYQILYSIGLFRNALNYLPTKYINHDISLIYKVGKDLGRACWPKKGAIFPVL